eukprot:4603598-Alexandrium_andersonii.AAC.1
MLRAESDGDDETSRRACRRRVPAGPGGRSPPGKAKVAEQSAIRQFELWLIITYHIESLQAKRAESTK